jgi:hypothetical protein
MVVLAAYSMIAAGDHKLSNKQVKQRIIEESIQNYYGNCPCPYNSARNGSRCGKRSAWSRGGGYAPICYEREVSAEMIKAWRAEQESADSAEKK